MNEFTGPKEWDGPGWGQPTVQGVPIPLSPPPQTNSGVVQTIQIHCSKLEPFSAIDFKGFCFL